MQKYPIGAILKHMESFCTSFPPIACKDSRVLILGSMPGAVSLAMQQYYAHPRNAFWPILYALWDEEMQDDYADRVAFALSHHIAIWDVAQSCVRTGSSDASIHDVRGNDFENFFATYPLIHTVFCNGRLAHTLFCKVADYVADERPCTLLPSTSPAYTLSVAEKTAAWQAVRHAVQD